MSDTWWLSFVNPWFAANEIVTTLLGLLGVETDIGAALNLFLGPLYMQLISTLMLAFYPLLIIVEIVQSLIILLFTPIIGLINAIMSIGNIFLGLVTVFNGVFPSPWIIAMTSIVTIVIALRVIQLLGGIEILGFSIGRG